MEPIYTFMLIVMAVLAITGLFIGVMNDAANFLNSAIGSRVAPLKVIMAVASLGIVIGTVTSTGMMEVARSGMFDPALFSFREVMILYFAVMLANIILLDVYNTMGLPTSTTVALIFCLLGSALAVSIVVITSNESVSLAEIGRYINSTRALAIMAGILLSVILAFTCGTAVMYVSRALFSFRYHRMFARLGAVWCGASFTAILYFALFKGLRSSLGGTAFMDFVDSHLLLSLAAIWAVASVLLHFLQMFRVNILKANILAGTFSLALAFAGNDLVNFIGVPVAGYDSYMMARGTGDMTMKMGALAGDVSANVFLLLGAGLIMIVTLWTSRRALSVSKTELSLSSQNEGEERYGSSAVSRGLVRVAMNMSTAYERVVPGRLRARLARRFDKLSEEEREGGAYDLIRATVNLTTASILISIATSMKLPLSTTYVCFMVSMGSSLADRAWGRESAVYRITGVLTVVSGWFVTGFGAFTIAFIVGLALMYGGNAAIVAVAVLCGWMLVRSNRRKNRQAAVQQEERPRTTSTEDVVTECLSEVGEAMGQVTRIYDRTLIAVFKENRKVLRDMVQQSNDLFYRSRERKYAVMPMLQKLQDSEIDTGHYYVQIVDYMNEVTKSLVHITRPSFEHIDHNPDGMTREQIDDRVRNGDDVEVIFNRINVMLRNHDFADIELILELRDELFESIAEAVKQQLRRIKNRETSTRASLLYLTILNETKTMVLQARNLVKSQRYFLEHTQLRPGK